MLRKAHDDEQGVALVFALLAVVILGGLAVLFASRSLTESRVTGNERDYETAIHVAEAGIDKVVSILNTQDSYVTRTAAGAAHVYTISTSASQADQRAWALAIAEGTDAGGSYKCVVVQVSRGEACAIRPQDSAGNVLPWIYGVGFSPSRSAPAGVRRVRVVKMGFDKGFFSPAKAVLTQGSLTIGGSLNVTGTGGGIHTNGGITINGNNVSTTGSVTATGTYDNTGGSSLPSGSGHVDYSQSIPPINALQIYTGSTTSTPAQDNAAKWNSSTQTYGTTSDPGMWFDLCPDGKARVPAFSSGVPAPCTGSVLYDASAANAPATFRGWTLSQDKWSAGGGSALLDGIYYVFEKNAEIAGNIGSSGSPARVTILADGRGVITPYAHPDTGTGCTFGGNTSGSITIKGTGSTASMSFQPYLQDLFLLADRDLDLQGNSSTAVEGFMGAHEQVSVTGNPSIAGAVFAEDGCDTGSSPVHANVVSGNFSLNHNSDMSTPLPSVVRVTAWNEY